MMAPKERNDDVIRMPDDFDIPMKTHEVFLCVLTIIVDSHLRLLIQYDVNYHTSVCGILQHLVQPILGVLKVLILLLILHLVADQQEVRGDHPIRYEDILLRVF